MEPSACKHRGKLETAVLKGGLFLRTKAAETEKIKTKNREGQGREKRDILNMQSGLRK